MENAQIASALQEIADLMDLQQENRFRIRTYRNAAQTVGGLSRRLEDMIKQGEEVRQLPNLGKSTVADISEILRRGTCSRLDKLRRKVPVGLIQIMRVPQVGPRKAMQLHQKLKVKSLPDLRKVCQDHRVRQLKGMGAKTEQNILNGIDILQSMSHRFLLKAADERIASVGRHLDQIKHIVRWEVAGSHRRGKETVGDLDILIHARNREQATRQILDYKETDEVVSRGKERVSVRLSGGLRVDFRFFQPASFGSALVYFTGSKAHNIALRKRMQKRRWKLNEYGLYKGKKRLAGKTEESIYQKLHLPWIPPELREDRGEIGAAEEDAIPALIEQRHLRGDLHCHTDASDGSDSIRAMAGCARERGYDYLAITDHSKAVTVANGLNETRLRKHADQIRQIDSSLKNFWLLAGVEVDILKNGELDLDEEVLAGLDWVVASVHSHFGLNQRQMTDRLLAAIRSGVVHCLGHPLGRLLGKRDPVAVDLGKLFQACREHSVCLEVNAQPDRLDLPDTYCQKARDEGVRFSIASDAHKKSNLDLIRYGVIQARRGWLTRRDVLNTVSATELRKRIRRK